MLGRQRLTAVTTPGVSYTGCSGCPRRPPQPLCALSTEESARLAGYSKGVPSWNELQASVPEKDLLNGYRVRPGQKPGTVGSSVLPTAESTVTKKSVLLYRDTSGWCPHCEKVGLPFPAAAVGDVGCILREPRYLDAVPHRSL